MTVKKLTPFIALVTLALQTGLQDSMKDAPDPPKVLMPFIHPCDDYLEGLRGESGFGVYIQDKHSRSPFRDSYHLAEDVWLPAGTEVRCVSDGTVMYSDFSPTWTDAQGFVHWNLGNVIVVEHRLSPSEGPLEYVCSVYVHLGAERKVKRGDRVERGQSIGIIGKHKSEENGGYPEHLHFGIHKGPYHQISPSWKKKLEKSALETGLPFGEKGEVVRGEIEIRPAGKAGVLVQFKETGEKGVLSLLVGSTSPDYRPMDIMGWCAGYGDAEAVKEWIRPSAWIKRHQPGK